MAPSTSTNLTMTFNNQLTTVHNQAPTSTSATISLANPEVSILNYQSTLYQPSAASMAAVAQRSMPLQTGTAQICARPDPFQQALIVCPLASKAYKPLPPSMLATQCVWKMPFPSSHKHQELSLFRSSQVCLLSRPGQVVPSRFCFPRHGSS